MKQFIVKAIESGEKLRNAIESINNQPVMAVSDSDFKITTGIDRSKWEQCEMCVSCGNCWYVTNDKDSVPCNKCVEFDQFDPVGFCRFCGRPMDDSDWEELEKKVFGE